MQRLTSPGLPVAIHCWRIDLADGVLDQRVVGLSAEEQARAARFVRPRDAVRYRRAHFALRLLLGVACGVSPSSLVFDVNAYGKPRLKRADGQSYRYFNLSHSEDQALVVISDRYELGVDIEVQRSIGDLPLLARSQLNPREYALWQALPENEQQRGFLSCWTRKEAAVKAIGAGLSIQAPEVDVGLADAGDTGSPVRLNHGRAELDDLQLGDLTVLSLPADSRCVMAVAYGLPLRSR